MLAIAGRRRDPVLPDVPTFSEAGLADFRVSQWFGLFAPRGTPESVLDIMHGAVQAALAAPQIEAQWDKQGARVELESRAEFARFVTADTATAVGYFEALGLPPTTEAGLASAPVQADSYTAAWSEQITATARPNPFWPYAESAQMEKLLAEEVQAVMIGSASAGDALGRAAEAIGKLVG